MDNSDYTANALAKIQDHLAGTECALDRIDERLAGIEHAADGIADCLHIRKKIHDPERLKLLTRIAEALEAIQEDLGKNGDYLQCLGPISTSLSRM